VTDTLDLVPARTLLVAQPLIRLELQPGDRVIAVIGDEVHVGDVLAERIRDARMVETATPREGADQGIPLPGTWLPGEHARAGRHPGAPAGELLFEHGGRRRLATGPHPDRLRAPADGRIVEVEPGVALVLQVAGAGLAATELLGEPHSGRMVVLPEDSDPRLALDVALAGAVVVLPGRVDAEALARARAMGIHGAVVGSLAERDRRDLVASAARQQAGLHRLAPFGVLVMGGYLRRAFPAAVQSVLDAAAGSLVGLVGDPPLLLLPMDLALPVPLADRVMVRGGIETGLEGRWLGPGGLRRVRSGIAAETGLVVLDDGRTVAIPIGELERFAVPVANG
jgi:hypothetical protein